MSAADKVTLVDTLNGAHLGTLAAAGTLGVIDDREVVNDADRLVGAVLCTLATTRIG